MTLVFHQRNEKILNQSSNQRFNDPRTPIMGFHEFMSDDFSIEKFVNIDSYSSSRGFLGYIEGKFWERYFVESLARSMTSMLRLDQVIIVSSLCVIPDAATACKRYQITDAQDFSDIRLLISHELIKELDDLDDESLKNHRGIEIDVLNTAITTVMRLDSVKGRFFIVNPEWNLVVYPHEDVGYGFIAMDDTSAALTKVKSMIKVLEAQHEFATQLIDPSQIK